jgi:o-succinylbenzoate synthase
MIIKNITVQRGSIPLKQPFITALRIVHTLESIIVRIETVSGIIGLGEAVPTAVITGDTTGSIAEAVEKYIAPALIGRSVLEFDSIMAALKGCIKKNTSAKAAVDMALYDICGQALNIPLYQLLGGAKTQLQTDITISLNDPPKMLEDSLSAVSAGYSILKLKVGRHGVSDASTISEIRKAVGPEVELRVDANQGWTPKESVKIIRQMEDLNCNVSLVEQPVSADNIDGMRFITSQVSTPILADESIFSAKDAIEVIRTGAADMINIKLMKTGGIYESLKICAIAEIYSVKCMMGCMLESRLAVSAAAHLAAAKNVLVMADLDGPALCAKDPYIGGPVFHRGDIIMSADPGIGVKLSQ